MRFALLRSKSALPSGNYRYFSSKNQKMLCIFCGRHTGRPYGMNDGLCKLNYNLSMGAASSINRYAFSLPHLAKLDRIDLFPYTVIEAALLLLLCSEVDIRSEPSVSRTISICVSIRRGKSEERHRITVDRCPAAVYGSLRQRKREAGQILLELW